MLAMGRVSKAPVCCQPDSFFRVTQHSKVKLSEAMQYAEGKLQQLSDIIEKQNAIFTVMPELKQFKVSIIAIIHNE